MAIEVNAADPSLGPVQRCASTTDGTDEISHVALVHPLTGSAPANASVDVASGQVLAANSSRKGFVLVNTSAAWIYIGIGNDAESGKGVALAPNGGTMNAVGQTARTAINALATVAGSNLAIQEFT